MSKKMMLLALSVVSAAMFALPAVASATPAHIDDPTGTITITPGTNVVTATLQNTNGEVVQCHKGVTGTGSFTTTTTGTINLEFNECTSGGFACRTTIAQGGTNPEVAGQIRTRTLTFHLITLNATHAGILITPAAEGFASFTCAGGLINRTVLGNGVIGEIDPTCGGETATPTVTFNQTNGVQSPKVHTGVTYNLTSNGFEAGEQAEAELHFPGLRKIICT